MKNDDYKRGFVPYAAAAFMIGLVGGFSAVLGPAFVSDIGIDYNNTTWTALAQAVSTAACAPILGKAGDIIGRNSALLLGAVVFTLGNILSALADSLIFMMAARFTVGVGTAFMAPVILAYIVTEFPQQQIARGFALYMLISSGSVVFGPTLGGLIISAYGWRAMLWVCVAVCAVTLATVAATSEKLSLRRKRLENFDSAGAVMILIFFSLMLCIPSFGQNFGFNSPAFWGVTISAAVSLPLLFFIEGRAANAILPLEFIGRRAFILSAAALFLTQGLMQANMTDIIVFTNYTRAGDSTVSGYAISVMYLGMSLGAVLLGPLADRFEPKYLLTLSLALTGIGCGMMLFFTEESSALPLMTSLGILGFGLGANATVLMKTALFEIPPEKAGAATGSYGLFRDLAAPFGVAVFVPFFTNSITAMMKEGMSGGQAACRSIAQLASAELICLAAGIVVVFFLPKIHAKGENQ